MLTAPPSGPRSYRAVRNPRRPVGLRLRVPRRGMTMRVGSRSTVPRDHRTVPIVPRRLATKRTSSRRPKSRSTRHLVGRRTGDRSRQMSRPRFHRKRDMKFPIEAPTRDHRAGTRPDPVTIRSLLQKHKADIAQRNWMSNLAIPPQKWQEIQKLQQLREQRLQEELAMERQRNEYREWMDRQMDRDNYGYDRYSANPNANRDERFSKFRISRPESLARTRHRRWLVVRSSRPNATDVFALA